MPRLSKASDKKVLGGNVVMNGPFVDQYPLKSV